MTLFKQIRLFIVQWKLHRAFGHDPVDYDYETMTAICSICGCKLNVWNDWVGGRLVVMGEAR